MKLIFKYTFIFLSGLSLMNVSHAESLGRLFISQEDRVKLDKVRNAKEEPKKIEVVEIEEILLPEVEEEEIEVINYSAINLRGLVHRKDGKNAAWINNSNTFEGDLESQYIHVNDDQIESDKVTIKLQDKSSAIELKVGDYYNPQLNE